MNKETNNGMMSKGTSKEMTEEMDKTVSYFHSNLINFIDELIEQFPTETDLVLARIYVKNRIQPITIINTFIQETLPYKDFISKRDEKAILDTKFSIGTNSNHFKMLWKSSALDDSDRTIIWKWLDTFVYLAEKYQKMKTMEWDMNDIPNAEKYKEI